MSLFANGRFAVLAALSTGLVTLYNTSLYFFPDSSVSRAIMPSLSGGHDYIPPPNVVLGARQLEPLYSGCTSTRFISAISEAYLRADGRSRMPLNYTLPLEDEWTSDDFVMSFDLPAYCPPPHIYTTEQACDLLQAFGGVRLRGDSLVRHVMNALMIVLTGKQTGAMNDHRDECRGEHIFDDRGHVCQRSIATASESAVDSVCGGDVWLDFDNAYVNDHIYDPDAFEGWIQRLPAHKRAYSPVFWFGGGLHYNLNSDWAIFFLIKRFFNRFNYAYPRPIGLWSAIHAPASNKPEQYLESQGPEAVLRYNARIEEVIKGLSPHDIVEQGGGLKMLDWYNMTNGSTSYDGTHYAYQVNMEKAMVLLNLLDLVWTEARDRGSIFSLKGESY